MKKILKYLKNLLLIIVFPALVYTVMVVFGAVIPVNQNPDKTAAKIEIFLLERGTHTDIVVPLETEIMNWKNMIDPEDFPYPKTNSKYIAFGWGDLEFYRTTPQWEDLRFKTAFNALFLKSSTALHLQLFSEIKEGKKSILIKINTQQYEKLVSYLKNSFEYNEQGETQVIPGLHYFKDDAFYKAKGSFHAFKTCNTWINNALKASEQKACLWTPFSEGLFYIYR